MSSRNTAIAVLIGVILAAVIYCQYMRIQELKLQLINDRKISKQVREKLLQLLQSDVDFDPEIKAELLSVVELLSIEQESKACFSIAKIVENLLKKIYENNERFAKRFKNPSFANYLLFAKEEKLISSEDYHLLELLRIMRNEEGHKVNVKKEKSRVLAAMMAGLLFIFRISVIAKQN